MVSAPQPSPLWPTVSFFNRRVKLSYFYFHSEIWRLERSRWSTCVIVPNFVTIGQTVADIWRFFDFSKMAAVHHLGFVMSMFRPPTKGIWWSLSLALARMFCVNLYSRRPILCLDIHANSRSQSYIASWQDQDTDIELHPCRARCPSAHDHAFIGTSV